MNYAVHASNTMWRIKNQASNYTSCSDNTLHLWVLVAGRVHWGLQVTSSFSISGCILKGCFERGIFQRAKSHLKGIEDFNLEYWWPPCKLFHQVEREGEREFHCHKRTANHSDGFWVPLHYHPVVYNPPSMKVTLININSLYLLTKSYSPHIAN